MHNYQGNRYHNLRSRKELASERRLLEMQSEMRKEQMSAQLGTLREFVSWGNIKLLIDERLEPLRNIAGIAGTAFSTIMSLLSGRRKRGCR